jgi:hypothetical protein
MVRIHRKLDSETLRLPELNPLIGLNVEITVEEQPPQVRDEFRAEASRTPETEKALEAQKAVFRSWRSDARFQPYWPTLDALLVHDLATIRIWAAIQAQCAA